MIALQRLNKTPPSRTIPLCIGLLQALARKWRWDLAPSGETADRIRKS